jgi:hypothetical protein
LRQAVGRKMKTCFLFELARSKVILSDEKSRSHHIKGEGISKINLP